ncbi:putative alanyl-tRNA synthetase [Heterostelium album PN500]|uniref:Putative alanyl-tRNA synthetase n=1 Tax=Heterostelium pallidum (strain ATCC 26659 / Pp 5 / PN500) TaxID=670386 RepID=D3B0P7_HETP5|nr:putative alanyl-tRNA synthetase [Heterostelium album PN500]EFA84871.1 putative alanyl-tRNA synthetase [Heterostelium album PN500]|eukprot:XP_020436982.1 putative alanyl-tRNA synthetase [Heterostelium album PN500]
MSEGKVKSRDSITDTACHVLKGAIVKVLNTPITVSVECQNKVKGRVCVEYTLDDKPDDSTLQKIEDECNRIIKENLPLNAFSMDRKEAEAKYTKEKVNNTYIYDKFPVPESVTTLTLVEIAGWNINCCPAVHLKSTGELGGIKISGINHRPQKKELEFRFDIVASDAVDNKKKKKGGAAPAVTVVDPLEEHRARISATNVKDLTARIVEMVIANANNQKTLEQTTIPEIQNLLTNLKNVSYSNGYNANK